MDYRSPVAGLQRQVDELTEELASLRAAPGEAELAVAEDCVLAKLRREAGRAEKQANRHRKKEHARELTPRERMHFARMQGGGVVALVLGGLGAVYLVVMTLLGAPFEDNETYIAVTAGFAVMGGALCVLVARADVRGRRAGRVGEDDFSSPE